MRSLPKLSTSNSEENVSLVSRTPPRRKPKELQQPQWTSFALVTIGTLLILATLYLLRKNLSFNESILHHSSHSSHHKTSQISETDEISPSSPLSAPSQKWLTAEILDLVDYTWLKTGDYKKFERKYKEISTKPLEAPQLSGHSEVINDIVTHLQNHKNEGFIVSFSKHKRLKPHPLPQSSNLQQTCKNLNILQTWIACRSDLSPEEISDHLPETTHNLLVALFDAFVDPGQCHPEASGAIYTSTKTFHFQRWTNNPCYNDPINVHRGSVENYESLIVSINQYNGAPGHFSPQQLPRILRALAVCPLNSKLLVASGKIPKQYVDILIERGIITRDRIVEFDANKTYFARVIFKPENYPYAYAKDKINDFTSYERSDMLLTRAAMTEDLADEERKSIVYVKRTGSRSVTNEKEVLKLIHEKASNLGFRVEIFWAEGHLREHIKMFQRAKILVAPHGAGLSNLYWVASGSFVIEFGYSTGMPLPDMYFQMSSHLDHIYYSCKAEGDYSSPMVVDIKEFKWQMNDIQRRIEGKPETPYNPKLESIKERFRIGN